MKRIRNLVIILAALVVLVAVAVIAGHRGQNALAVKVVTVKPAIFLTKLPENGVVAHPRVATVPTLVSGNIAHIYVKAGDRVSAGELLATIDNPTLESNAAGSQADYDSSVANIQTAKIDEQNAKVTYEAAVATAKSNLDEAQRVYDADASLYASKAIARTQIDADKAKFVQAQVQYNQAVQQLHLGAVTGYGQNSEQYAQAAAQKAQILNASNQQQLAFTRIVAPFDGIIQTVATQQNDPLTDMRSGDPVTQGQALFTIAAGDTYIVKAQVDEQDIINVHPGQQANITGEDFPGQTIVGHVVDISPVAIKSTDPSSTAKQVVTSIRLDRSPAFLRDGMSVDVDILTANVPDTKLVPTAAIQKDAKTSYVYVVRSGKAVKTTVKTAASNDTQTIVTAGVRFGDVVVAEKNALLHNGAAVRALPSASPSPAM